MRAALLVAAALATSSSSSTVVATPDRAGARPVALTLSFHALLECGRVQARTIVVDVPAAVRLPRRVPPASVRILRARPASVGVHAHELTFRQRAPSGVVCTSLTFGPARIVVAPAAGIGNPPRSGRYTFVIHVSGRATRAVLRVRRSALKP